MIRGMNLKKRICFVLDQFLYGGIERVAINYLQNIDMKKYCVDVVILSNVEDMIQHIPKDCNIIKINIPRNHNPLSRASTMVRRPAGAILYYGTYLLKKFFISPVDLFKTRILRNKEYDVAIAFSGHLNDCYVVLNCIKANKKIVWAHGMIYQYLLMSPAFEKMYSKFDKIVSINHLNQNDIFYCKPYLNYKIENLYNPAMIEDTKLSEIELNNLSQKYGDYILSVARLETPKDFLTLVKAFKILKDNNKTKCNLVIVGDGPDRSKIETYIKQNNLENNIFLVGSQDDVAKFYKTAKLFVLSTESEGLGMVIIEAMNFGLPVIATDAPYGPRDIIRNNEFGVLTPVGDEKLLAQEINTLLENEELYNYYKNQSLKRYLDFIPEKIMEQFYEIIGEDQNGK